MDSKQYIGLALRTESVPAQLNIDQTALHASLAIAIAAGNLLDQVKRRLFYGTPLTLEKCNEHLQTMLFLANFMGMALTESSDEVNTAMSQEEFDKIELPDTLKGMKLENLNIRLLHAAIGGFTENGEKLEALMKQYETGKLDLVNFGEENGDCQWYNAIEIDELTKLAAAEGLNPVDFSERGLRIKNITKLQGNEKLKGRYADGDFDAVAALNRDLAAERALLETSTERPVDLKADAEQRESIVGQVANGEQQKAA